MTEKFATLFWSSKMLQNMISKWFIWLWWWPEWNYFTTIYPFSHSFSLSRYHFTRINYANERRRDDAENESKLKKRKSFLAFDSSQTKTDKDLFVCYIVNAEDNLRSVLAVIKEFNKALTSSEKKQTHIDLFKIEMALFGFVSVKRKRKKCSSAAPCFVAVRMMSVMPSDKIV